MTWDVAEGFETLSKPAAQTAKLPLTCDLTLRRVTLDHAVSPPSVGKMGAERQKGDRFGDSGW
jgi:hypothetical protein